MLPVILVHLWCIQNKLVLKKDTDIIHVTMGGGGGSKKFSHMLRGVQKVLAACEGGQKSLTTKIFNCPAPPPTKVFMNTLLGICYNKVLFSTHGS